LMKDLDLNLLPIAVALYEEGSVTRAAIRLGMSQPNVSKALAKLRWALGEELFLKTSSGVVPTARAVSFVKSAQEMLAHLQMGLLSPDDFKPESTKITVRVALSEVDELLWLPKLLKSIRNCAPRITLTPVHVPIDKLTSGLESGEINLAVGIHPELREMGFFRQRLIRLRPTCLMRADHPMRSAALSMEEYLRLDHIAVGAGHNLSTIERLLQSRNRPRNVVFSVSHFLCLPEILEQTDFVATINRLLAGYFCRTNPKLKTVEAPAEVRGFEIRQFWHRKFNDDAVNKWLRELVRGTIAPYSNSV
jgi:DNA-binding transcriptional LysR family regulator